jgi:hypothetical protein
VNLDYVGRYERVPAHTTVDWMETVIGETGRSGFHFVDEALPPSALRNLSHELLRRGLTTSWWGNVRFERAFTPELVDLLASAGCVGVTGGLEVPVDRLLIEMSKGITVAQAIRVMRAFADRNILVHAYLMYGFPGQTLQEMVDGLEVVRQLFAARLLANAYWHRFSLTRHSPIGRRHLASSRARQPSAALGDLELTIVPQRALDFGHIQRALAASLAAYKEGAALERPVTEWFDQGVPEPTIAREYVVEALSPIGS